MIGVQCVNPATLRMTPETVEIESEDTDTETKETAEVDVCPRHVREEVILIIIAITDNPPAI